MKTAKFTLPLSLIQSADAQDNPLVTWMSFVFVDDAPNHNLQGIPQAAFASLVETGVLMPIKMEEGKIGGHPSSKPLGVIKHLNTVENQVLGEAVLWNDERPSDIALLKQSYSEDKPLDISFELKYSESEMDEDDIEWILDPIVRGATIVTNPAYGGRTPILSVASKDDYSELPDNCFAFIESGGVEQDSFTSPRNLRHFPYKDATGEISETLLTKSLEEIEDITFDQKQQVLYVLQAAYLGLEKEHVTLMDEKKIEELEVALASLRDQIVALETQISDIQTERDTLLEYKTNREREDTEAALLKDRLTILTEAGFEFDDEQVSTNRGLWLTLDEEAFVVYVSHLKEVKESNASVEGNPVIPDLSSTASNENNLDTLRQFLDEEFKPNKETE